MTVSELYSQRQGREFQAIPKFYAMSEHGISVTP